MEEKRITVNGKTMNYRRNGKGTPVIYVHGNYGCNRWFDKVMDISNAHTVAPDLPNFGESDPLDEADIDVYADYLYAFLQELQNEIQVFPPYVLVGHSLGGGVAISLTLRHPEAVDRLMLVDSAPLNGLTIAEDHYPLVEMFKSDRNLLKQSLQAVTPTLEDDAFLDTLTDAAFRMNSIAFSGNLGALERFDYTGMGERFTGPVLVVVGAKDVIINPDMARQTAAAFPNGEVRVLDHVGHSVMVEDPKTFISMLTEFLGR
jgi:branched-chain amino acid transport system permease protein